MYFCVKNNWLQPYIVGCHHMKSIFQLFFCLSLDDRCRLGRAVFRNKNFHFSQWMYSGRYFWLSNFNVISLISSSNFYTSISYDILTHSELLLILYFINSVHFPGTSKQAYCKLSFNSFLIHIFPDLIIESHMFKYGNIGLIVAVAIYFIYFLGYI